MNFSTNISILALSISIVALLVIFLAYKAKNSSFGNNDTNKFRKQGHIATIVGVVISIIGIGASLIEVFLFKNFINEKEVITINIPKIDSLIHTNESPPLQINTIKNKKILIGDISIRGVIVDRDNGNAIEDADIFILENQIVKSDVHGNFNFVISEKSWKKSIHMRVYKKGYNDYALDISPYSNELTNIALERKH